MFIIVSMKIIIVGVGKIGKTLVANFINEDHDVIVIDNKRQAVETLVNLYDVKGFVGGALERDILIDAEVNGCDLFIACTSRDEMNILTCVLAKKLGAKRTIARVRDPEYLKEMQNLTEDLGLDLIFNPEKRTAFEIANSLKFPSANNLEVFAGGRALMVEFEIEKGNPLIGESLMEISKLYGSKVLFGMVKRDKKVYIPNGSFVIEREDKVHVIGSEKEIGAFCKKVKMFKPRAKSVMIVGGGKIAVHLATELTQTPEINVKIIEEDRATCEYLAEILPRATVICGDATDQALLSEEKISECDACVTLTDYDESNVVVSLYAKQKQVEKVITKINRTSMYDMAEYIGLDTVVSPRIAIANQILGFVRSHKTEVDKGISNFYKLSDGVEAIEFSVAEGFAFANTPLKRLKIKSNALIGGIVRDNEFILPSGDTCITVGDRVIVVSGGKRINALEEIFR